MTIRHQDKYLIVKLHTQDWVGGKANTVIGFIKALPKNSRFYNGFYKEWRINKYMVEPSDIEQLFAYNMIEEEPKDNFDAEKWKDDTFGKKEELI